MIPVTKSFLPKFEDYIFQLKRVYSNEWLTNRGELVKELEKKIHNYLSTNSEPIIMNNGTIPIQIALKLLGNKGEIITTPFSYVATTSAIIWENCEPVFVDIHPEYLTIDEMLIEKAITSRTTCILATHVFGNPCNIDVIEKIAKRYNLKIIYDAAHCFAVNYNGSSIFNFGDISTCSFHATKLFHTGEGGAAFVKNQELFNRVFYSHNFGHNGPLDFYGLGINGKISELNTAMGLAVFPYLNDIIASRKKIVDIYFQNLKFNYYRSMKLRELTDWNYSYFPIIFQSEEQLIKVQQLLNDNDIYPRRYFYPSLNKLTFVSEYFQCSISENIAKTIMCLPLYVGLEEEDQFRVINIINGVFK